METTDRANIPLTNSQIIDSLKNDPLCKLAATATTNYIRVILREEEFNDKIIPVTKITPADLGEDENDKPFRWITVEPTSPSAVVLPQDGSAMVTPYYARKARIQYNRLSTRKYRKDITELDTYKNIDLRKVMADIGINELGKRRDWQMVTLFDSACNTNYNNAPIDFVGGFTRNNLFEMKKIFPRRSLVAAQALVNETTKSEFCKYDRNTAGGDFAQETLLKGETVIGDSFAGLKWITTIKSDIVPDNTVYLTAAPNFLGVNEEFQPVTMFIERKENAITMHATCMIGMAIVNTNGVAKAGFFTGQDFFVNTRYPFEQATNPAYTASK